MILRSLPLLLPSLFPFSFSSVQFQTSLISFSCLSFGIPPARASCSAIGFRGSVFVTPLSREPCTVNLYSLGRLVRPLKRKPSCKLFGRPPFPPLSSAPRSPSRSAAQTISELPPFLPLLGSSDAERDGLAAAAGSVVAAVAVHQTEFSSITDDNMLLLARTPR